MNKFDAIGIVCPECRTELLQVDQSLICGNGECRRLYQILDGIPVLLTDAATVLDEESWASATAAAGPAGTADGSAVDET